MAEKQIAWASGEGYITVTFSGDGNGSVSVASDANTIFKAREQHITIRTLLGSPEQEETIIVKQEGKPVSTGAVIDFSYTGRVQEVTLPAGRYRLQCWGAQGGNVTDSYAVNGSKGGYSEGVLVLKEPKTLYVFVGGQGTSYTSSTSQTDTQVLNGGWNGGGAGRRTTHSNSGNIDGRSFPRSGGGATDIALVTSTMSYSFGRTNRSSESLLSRIIVAGGGAGASARYTITTTTTTSTSETTVATYSKTLNSTSTNVTPYAGVKETNVKASTQYKIKDFTGTFVTVEYYGASGYIGNNNGATTFTSPSGCTYFWIYLYDSASSSGGSVSATLVEVVTTSSTNTSTTSGKSSGAQQGGGTSGKGQYPGKQNAAGNGGAFGFGADQSSPSYRYCGGGGGGGWYGGGSNNSDTTATYVNYSGGGSGFVNTAANASYRPSGYTGIELASGSTTAGSSSHPSTSGGSETGHSGNGYAIITALDENWLADDYTKVEYIRPDGTQYIDTGVKPSVNTAIHVRIGNIALPRAGDHALFGTGWGYCSLLYSSVSTIRWYTNASLVSVPVSTSTSPVDLIATLTYLSVNGVKYSVAGNGWPNLNICLFNTGDNANGSGTWRGIASLYGCQIYDGSNLIRDFVPCKQNSTNTYGLYDMVNNVFYPMKK